MKERIQKIIARAGLASRREADAWVRDGLVTINGRPAVLGDKADAEKDAIKVSGKLLKSKSGGGAKGQNAIYFFYKPAGVISMLNEDRSGRATLREFFDKVPERLFPVGRLGFNQEGLVILTNDGDFSEALLKRKTLLRTFHVKTSDVPDSSTLEKLRRSARMEKVRISPVSAEVIRRFARNAIVEWTAQGPSTMDVKLFFEHRGVRVEKVALMSIGLRDADKGGVAAIISVDGLQPGQWRKLAPKQADALRAIVSPTRVVAS